MASLYPMPSICATGRCKRSFPFAFATGFTGEKPYNQICRTRAARREYRAGEGRHDRRLCGQRVCAQRADGLSAAALHGPSCGGAAEKASVSPGRTGGRRIRRGSVPAGMRLSRPDAGEAGFWRGTGPHRLRRGGEAAAADSFAAGGLLRHGRVRAGAGADFRRRRAGGERHLLYRCGRQGSGHCRHCRLHCAAGGVPGRRPPGDAG